jgi:Zn-dependent protease with chaperone function
MRQLAGRPALLALVGGLVVARLAWHPGRAICGQMTVAGCLGVAVLVVAALVVASWVGRASWLAIGAVRAVAGLPRLATPAALVAATRRSGVGDVVYIDGPASSAFCAGLLRPRVFVTGGMVAALAAEELDAVLVHEAEHARRRDPLRRLAARAAADVLFWLPLVGWWSRRRLEDAELAADRAAIDRVGRTPLARALRHRDPGDPGDRRGPVRRGGTGPGDPAARRRAPTPASAAGGLPAVAAGPDPGGQPGHVRRPGPGQRGHRLNRPPPARSRIGRQCPPGGPAS